MRIEFIIHFVEHHLDLFLFYPLFLNLHPSFSFLVFLLLVTVRISHIRSVLMHIFPLKFRIRYSYNLEK